MELIASGIIRQAQNHISAFLNCCRHLLPCSHVMVSQRRSVKDLDLYGKTAEKFLSLKPACCVSDASETPPEGDSTPVSAGSLSAASSRWRECRTHMHFVLSRGGKYQHCWLFSSVLKQHADFDSHNCKSWVRCGVQGGCSFCFKTLIVQSKDNTMWCCVSFFSWVGVLIFS